jgi:hypothetical protein
MHPCESMRACGNLPILPQTLCFQSASVGTSPNGTTSMQACLHAFPCQCMPVRARRLACKLAHMHPYAPCAGPHPNTRTQTCMCARAATSEPAASRIRMCSHHGGWDLRWPWRADFESRNCRVGGKSGREGSGPQTPIPERQVHHTTSTRSLCMRTSVGQHRVSRPQCTHSPRQGSDTAMMAEVANSERA